jgi:hypothetical protein
MESRTPQAKPSPLVVWWIMWFGIVSSVVAMYFVLGRSPANGRVPQEGPVQFIGLAPLAFSCVLRWFFFPRQNEAKKAFVTFILGLALAEGGGLISLALGGGMKEELFLLALLGVLQWAPLGARRLFDPPAGRAHGLRSP